MPLSRLLRQRGERGTSGGEGRLFGLGQPFLAPGQRGEEAFFRPGIRLPLVCGQLRQAANSIAASCGHGLAPHDAQPLGRGPGHGGFEVVQLGVQTHRIRLDDAARDGTQRLGMGSGHVAALQPLGDVVQRRD